MTFAQLPDEFLSTPKLDGLGGDVASLYVDMLSYGNHWHSDGVVTREALARASRMGAERVAAALDLLILRGVAFEVVDAPEPTVRVSWTWQLTALQVKDRKAAHNAAQAKFAAGRR